MDESILGQVWRLREFVRQAVIRDLKIRYKRSVLGILWSVLNPLLLMTVMGIAFGIFLRFKIEHYPVFLFSGLIVWQFMQTVAVECLDQLVGTSNVAIYTKVRVPKLIFPLAHTTSLFVNLLCSLGAMTIVMAFFRITPQASMLMIFPALVVIYFFALGFGLMAAYLNVFFRDTKYFVPVLFTGLFYLTPVIYDISLVPEQYRHFILLNPFYYFVELARFPLYRGEVAPLQLWAMTSSLSVLSAMIGFFVASKAEEKVAYHV